MPGAGLVISGQIAWHSSVLSGATLDVKKELIRKLLFLFRL